MGYLNEYTEICCNTYSHQEYVKGLKQLKEKIGDSNHPLSVLIDGDFARNNAQFTECERLYKKAYETDQNNYLFNCKMLEMLDFREQEDLLNTEYFDVISERQDLLSILTKMELYIRNHDFNNYAIEFIRFKQSSSIDSRLVRYHQAINYSIQGDYQHAYKVLKLLYEEEPFNPNVYNDLAYAMYELEMYESAIDVVMDGLEMDSKNYKLHHLLVVILYTKSEFELISQHLGFCYTVNPTSYQLNVYMYILEMDINKNYEKGLEYAKNLVLMQKTILTMNYVCGAYKGLKQFNQYLDTALEMVSLYPENAVPYNLLAAAHYYLKFDKHIILENMTESISLTSPSLTELSAIFLSIKNDYVFVLKEFLVQPELVIRRMFDDYNTHKSLGFVYAFEQYTRDFDIDVLTDIIDKYCNINNEFVSFFKSLIFIMRNRYKVYESTKVMETLLRQVSGPKLFFELAQMFIELGDKTCAIQLLHHGRQYYQSTDDMLRYANLMVTCGFPMTATNYLKFFRDNQKDKLLSSDIKLINDARHKFFQFIRHRERDPKLDQIMFESLLIQEQVQLKQDEFKHFLRRKSQTSDEIIFHNLRKWNSYTPILSKSGGDSVGGGFYLNIKGKGVVIDPGLNFVENFKNAGYSFDDIDTIVISHAHNDHTADIESILTLLYKYNSDITDLFNMIEQQEKSETIKVLKSHDGLKNTSYGVVNEALIRFKFEPDEVQQNLSKYIKVLEFYMTKSTFKKYAGLFNLHKSSNYRIHLIEGGNDYDIIDDPKNYGLYIFNNEHKEVISDYSSIGLVLKMQNYNLVYTGDTKISDYVIKQIRSTIKKTKQSAKSKQIFLCNLGGFKQYEVEYDLNGYKNIYKNHLGRIGLYTLLNEFKPNLCLISEFGEEFEMQRLAITEVFDKAFPAITFFPCEIGQTLKIGETILINTHTVSSTNKRIPEYSEQFTELKDAHYIDDIKGNIYYVDNNIIKRHLSDFIRYKSNIK